MINKTYGAKGVARSGFVPEVNVLRCARIPFLIRLRIVLSTKQVAFAVYDDRKNGKYGLWKAQVELKRLYDAKMVKRMRSMATKDYLYYVDAKPEFPDHDYLVNWVWLALNRSGKMELFENEKNIETHIADAYFIYNKQPYFLELHHLRNEFDKAPMYIQHFKKGHWAGDDWPGGKRYAVIIVAVTNEADRTWIRKVIEKQNQGEFKLRFKVLLLKEIWNNPGVIEWDSQGPPEKQGG